MPLISVVIPTHNRPEMLAEALASVRAQTFDDYEIIVVSNGETAEDRARSREAAALCGAAWFSLTDGNLPAARNFGIEKSRGEWVAFLDDDDLWLPHRLERHICEAKRTGADMISSHPKRLVPDGWSYLRAASHDMPWAAPSAIMVRRQVLCLLGGFDVRQRFVEDIDLWRRISWRHRIHHTDDDLVCLRSGHSTMTTRQWAMFLYGLRHFVKMHVDTPRDLRSSLPVLPRAALGQIFGLAPNWLIRLRPLHRIRMLFGASQ